MYFAGRPGGLHEPLTGRAWSPAEIESRVAGRAAVWRDAGLQPGQRVLFHLGNNLEFFVDLLAVWHLGGTVIPVDGRLTPFEVETLAEAADARFSLRHGDADQTDAAVTAGPESVSVTTADESSRPELGPSGLMLDGDALILFTSGTTGDPKGVVHTHRTLRARWMGLAQALGTEPFERSLCALPTHFGHGLICNALFPWLSGNELYVLPPFRADTLADLGRLIDEHAITFISSVPSLWKLALRVAIPPAELSLRRVHVGSAPLSADLWRQVQEWTGTRHVVNSYGITETGSWVAGLIDGPENPVDGLIGVGWGAVVKVFTSSEPGIPMAERNEAGTGEPGFVWLNTPALMAGYFRRPDLTSAVVEDGWFFTGDIGILDERGQLHLKGRVREEINKGGMKVYPGDVDGVAEQHPLVADACAFAVEDDLYGQDVAIALVVEDRNGLESIRSFMSERLAAHQMPRRWYLLKEIPRTSRGKINRETVAASCAEREPDRPGA